MRRPAAHKPSSHNPRSTKGKRTAPPRIVEVVIDSLGARGDGVGRTDDGGSAAIFVPRTVPGDRVLAAIEGKRGDGLSATLVEILEAGEGRVEPVCPHYAQCGGCQAQHLSPELYASWKQGLLVEALGRVGLGATPIDPLIAIPPGQRRRAVLAYHRRRSLQLGFNARASHQLVEIESCPILDPALVALLPGLRALLSDVIPEGEDGDCHIALADNGADVLVEGEARLDLFDREKLADHAVRLDLARLAWRRPGVGFAEPVAARRAPRITLGKANVEPPPGAFFQPSQAGEDAIAALCLEAIGDASPVADLFCGLGSFTFPLAAKAVVHGVEGDRDAVHALKAAADRAGSALRVTVEQRDLFGRPLMAQDLKRFQAVLFDPPRAGAAAQATHLATSGVPLIVAVSCNPATLARDLRTLVDGGYRIERITPIDQFPWSAHLEAVAVLRK